MKYSLSGKTLTNTLNIMYIRSKKIHHQSFSSPEKKKKNSASYQCGWFIHQNQVTNVMKVKNSRRRILQKLGCKLELPFGSIGKVSGRGISQFSPLKYILRGKAHPLLNVNESVSLLKSISEDNEPT
jgi:hypothetical protein